MRRIVVSLALVMVVVLALSAPMAEAKKDRHERRDTSRSTGVAAINPTASNADTQIIQNAPTTNDGGGASLWVDGDDPSGSSKDRAGLIKWDLSGIASGTKVSSASVTLSVTNSSTQTYQAYKLKQPWTESGATWNAYASSKPWQVAGAQGLLDRDAVAVGNITPSATGQQTFVLSPAAVQSWIDNPASNQGIVMANSNNADGFIFYSREASDVSKRPQLTINFASGGDPVLVGAGDIASCSSTGDEATANLLDNIAGTVFAAGDNVYNSGTPTEFNNCYGPSWGRHKARTYPSTGNHEYLTANASGYFSYFGAAAGDPSKGYYSYNLGEWHIIVLNSMCENVGGCGATSPMVTWLTTDIATNPKTCTLAYWHHPLFTSGSAGNQTKMKPSWDALYAANADVVLSGHAHIYERFAPQTPNAIADPVRGIREFVVGTGGVSHQPLGTIKPNSEVRNTDTFGVLKLTLRSGRYDWQFVPEAGKTFTDLGSANCH